MGKKGGKAFLKSARAGRAEAEAEEEGQQAAPQEPVSAVSAPQAQQQQQQAQAAQQPSGKAAAIVDKKPSAAADSDASGSDNEEGEAGVETRGKMLQRHKRVGWGVAQQGNLS
jgi:hypothetical protein